MYIKHVILKKETLVQGVALIFLFSPHQCRRSGVE